MAASRRRVDPDAAAYFAAIVAAGSTISSANQAAVNAFVVGCKTDGIWSAIKASCILAGADTLAGALVPLVGDAPTNVGSGFVSGDYSRTTGLLGDGSTKYLNSNRAGNADAQNNMHYGCYVSVSGTLNRALMGDESSSAGNPTQLYTNFSRCRASTSFTHSISTADGTGFVGISRSASGNYFHRRSGTTDNPSTASTGQNSQNIMVFARELSDRNNCRMSFYSIGESLNLALLDARLATYMSSLT